MPTVPAPPKRAAALPPEARRAAIIESVRPLLIEYGEHITSRQIADAAGIAEGTIFRVFSDKDELIDAAVDAALDPEPFERAVREIDSELPLSEQLLAVVALAQRRSDDIWRLVSSLRSERRQELKRPLSVSPAIRELFEAERHRLRVEPAAAAKMLRALTLSMTHPLLASDPASAEEIVDIVLHGIATSDDVIRR